MIDQEMLEAMRQLIAPLESKIANIEEKTSIIPTLQSDITGMKSEIVGMKSEITGMKSEIAGMKSEITGMKKDISETKTLLESDIYPKIDSLAEGHQAMVDTQKAILRRFSDSEQVEPRVSVLETVVKIHSEDIRELKKAL